MRSVYDVVQASNRKVVASFENKTAAKEERDRLNGPKTPTQVERDLPGSFVISRGKDHPAGPSIYQRPGRR